MPRDLIRYDLKVEEALRSVVRDVLVDAAAQGLPGEHHFYVTFQCDHPDVELPQFLRERYPEEMTIVLQHQYWDLTVTEEGFSVTLSFSDMPYRLVVPFSAVVAFADPSVRFGLQFEAAKRAIQSARDEADDSSESEPSVPEQEALRREDSIPSDSHSDESEESEESEEKVVALDTFRKK